MNKSMKKILAFALVLVLTLTLLPDTFRAFATPRTYSINFGSASYVVGNVTVTASVAGKDITAGAVELTADEAISLTNFNPDTMEAKLTAADGFNTTLTVDTNGNTSVSQNDAAGGVPDTLSFVVQPKNNNNNPAPPAGNTNAIIKLKGPDGSWQVDPMVYEDYDITTPEYASAPYEKYAFVTNISINNSQKTESVGHYNKNASIDNLKSQNISYNKDAGATTVNFQFFTGWGDRIEMVKINGIEYPIPLNYDNRYDWLNAFCDQGILFEIKNVPVSTDLDANNNEIYDIELQVRPITSKECYIGNFLWSNDDYFAPDGENPSDLYIGHSTLTLLSVDYNDGDPAYDFEANGGYKHLDIDATSGAGGLDKVNYVHYELDRMGTAASSQPVATSEMVIPEGSWVTMKIEPHYGYQVKSFSGVGQEDIKLNGGTSVFSFKVGKGNFHIGAHVEEQENDAEIGSKTVSDAGVILADGTLDSGSARLYVEDAKVSEAKKEEFEAEIADTNYEIESYLDINLSQVFFKGTGDASDVWAYPMEDLTKAATVGLVLDGLDADDDVVLIHNIHDGDKFEVIEAEYNEEANAFFFETNSFSDYAIATRPAADAEIEDATNPSKNAMSADLGNSLEELKAFVLTEEDLKALAAGEDVSIWLEVTDIASTISSDEKSKVEKAISDLSDGYKIGSYLDIDLFKKIGVKASAVTTTNGKLKITLTLPESLQGDYSFKIVQLHDGVTTVIDATYDKTKHTLTFETDKFSTYAIAYKENAKTADKATTAAATTAASKTTSPKTGDAALPILAFFLLGASALTGVVIIKKHK